MRLLPSLVLLTALAQSSLASILAIDYGAEWTKISLVKPGLPFDVVLNKDSKRKVQSVVGWKKDERLFGGEASAVSGRFPHDSFPYLKPLIGSPYSPEDTNSTIRFPSILTPTSRNTLGFTRGSSKKSDESWSVEELVGMQFSYARELAETLAGERVTDAVVAVPGWFGQFERQAVEDALEIAGLKSVGLINDGAAVGINYAMNRLFPTKEYHLIYDSGALSTSASLISFHTYPVVPPSPLLANNKRSKSKVLPKPVNTTHIEVLGLGFDRQLGGTFLDEMIKDMIVGEFEEKVGLKIEGGEREKALAKVWKEAGRVKSVLSANSDSAVTIEALFDDRDFKSRISREQLESAASHYLTEKRFEQPIWTALSQANMTVDDINSLILFGGNSRVPFVQAAVRAAVGDAKIAQNVNTDEAGVLGAAFYGATQSRQFKTKEVKVIDLQPYDVQASYSVEARSATDKARTIHTKLFPAGSKTGIKKTLKLKKKADFNLDFSYIQKPDQDLPFPPTLLRASISGLTAALANLTDSEQTLNPDPIVRVTVQVSDSGLVQVLDASAVFDSLKVVEDASFGAKFKGLFGGSKEKEGAQEDAGEVEKEEVEAAGAGRNETGGGEKKGEEKVEERLVKLKVEIKQGDVARMSPMGKKESRSRLLSIDALELARRQREEAFNVLEGYLYRLRDLLAPPPPATEGSTPTITSIFHDYSTEDERDRLGKMSAETLEWLGEDGWNAPTDDLVKKRGDLEAIEKPIQFRNLEAQKRAGSIEKFQQALYAGRAFIQSAKENATLALAADPPLPQKYTTSEIDTTHLAMITLEEWLGRLMDEHKTKKMNEDSPLKTAELDEKGLQFQERVRGLLRRKEPVVEKKKEKKEMKEKKAEETTKADGEGEGAADEVQEEEVSSSEGKEETEEPLAGHQKDEL